MPKQNLDAKGIRAICMHCIWWYKIALNIKGRGICNALPPQPVFIGKGFASAKPETGAEDLCMYFRPNMSLIDGD